MRDFADYQGESDHERFIELEDEYHRRFADIDSYLRAVHDAEIEGAVAAVENQPGYDEVTR